MKPTAIRSIGRAFALTVALLAAGPLACSKPMPGDLIISDITTGRILNPDGSTIQDDSKTNLFWSNDTFYVSVQTEGSAKDVKLQARWTGPDGKVVGEDTKTISPTGPLVTALQLAPKDRWENGDYKVEILVNGTVQGERVVNAR